MELQQLKYFLEVAESQHITQSAQRLHIAQPALSQSIHRLEGELGVKLFVHKGRNIVLTAYGKYLYSRLKPIIDTIDKLPDQLATMADENRRTIHLNVLAASSLVTQAIIEYEKHRSDIKFQLLQNPENDDYDIEITTAMPGKAEKSEYRFVCPEKIFLAVPNKQEYENVSSVNLSQVADANFISLMGSKQFRYICDKFCRQAGVIPNIVFESDSPAAVKNMIGASLGIGFWPEFTWGKTESKSVKLIEIEKPSCSRDIAVNCKNTANNNVKDFFIFLKNYIIKEKARSEK
ncbi:MAG: LysR family transcriptional regulator [Eubacterium sp.]